MTEPNVIQHVRLAKLTKSPDNVRTTPASQADDDQLKASIAARGLLQPLIVRPASRKGHFEVTAGGRRLDALKALQKGKTLKTTYEAPCIVRPETAKEDSLAENLHRAAMHPADEFVAFAGLIEEGADTAGIAERFGVTQKHVRQRLKLGNAAPELVQAYRDKKMDLDTLMAFTVTDDPDAQRTVWEQVKQLYHVSPLTVKQRLTEGSIPADSRLGRFIGIEDYEKAGGAVERDLFTPEDDCYFTDATLVRELANQKLADAATTLEAEWKWAKPMLDVSFGFAAEYARVYPTPIDPPKKVVQELKKLNNRFDEIEAVPDDAWTDELADEAETIDEQRAELQAIVDNSAEYTAEDKARAGCIVTIDQQGEIVAHAGLIPRDEAAEAGADGDAPTETTASPNGHDPAGGYEAPVTAEQVTRKAHGISQAHLDDLKAYRLQIVQSHLTQRFDVAFDAALYSLCMSVLHLGYFANPLDLRATPSRPQSSLNDLGETSAHAQLEAQFATLAKSWTGLKPAEAFDAMSSLPMEQKQALFAWCVAQCLEPQLAFEDKANPVIEQIGARLDIDFAAHWRPTADNYWGRVKKDHALDVGSTTLGEQWGREFGKSKKTELAKVLERAFDSAKADSLVLADDVRAKAAGWTPPGFDFSAAIEAPDDPAGGSNGSDDVAHNESPGEPTTDDENSTELPAFLKGEDGAAAADDTNAA